MCNLPTITLSFKDWIELHRIHGEMAGALLAMSWELPKDERRERLENLIQDCDARMTSISERKQPNDHHS